MHNGIFDECLAAIEFIADNSIEKFSFISTVSNSSLQHIIQSNLYCMPRKLSRLMLWVLVDKSLELKPFRYALILSQPMTSEYKDISISYGFILRI